MTTHPFRPIIQLLAIIALLLPGAGFANANQSGGVDLRIWTVNSAGEPVFDICYTLVEYSNLGCDENLDGNVLFEDVAPGRYYVEPTMHPDGFYWAEPFTILVDENHTDHVVEAYEYRSGSSAESEVYPPVDVHLITRDPDTGEVILDACYELVGYSNIGCDENRDGHITFADIPLSTYTIRQTTTPAGYETMDDYTISIMPTDLNGPFVVLLSQSNPQAPDNDHNNISIVFYDVQTNQRVADPENCAQLYIGRDSKSLLGCDEDVVDGQVDFMRAAFDPQDDSATVRIGTMCGYQIVAGQSFQLLWVGQHSAFIFVALEPTNEFCG